MFGQINNTYTWISKSVKNLLESETEAKSLQRKILGVGLFSSAALGVSPFFYEKNGKVLPVLGAVTVLVLSVMGVRAIKDYEDPEELSEMRTSALLSDFFDVVDFHGSVEKILDSAILTSKELVDKAVNVQEVAAKSLITSCQEIKSSLTKKEKISVRSLQDSVGQMGKYVDRMDQASKALDKISDWEKQIRA